jgi:hypothetical protein
LAQALAHGSGITMNYSIKSMFEHHQFAYPDLALDAGGLYGIVDHHDPPLHFPSVMPAPLYKCPTGPARTKS